MRYPTIAVELDAAGRAIVTHDGVKRGTLHAWCGRDIEVIFRKPLNVLR